MTASDGSSVLPAVTRSQGGYLAVVLLVLAPSFLVALAMSSLYFVVMPAMPFLREYYFSQQEQTYATYVVPLLTHIAGGTVALIVGPINLVNALRNGYTRTHRVFGSIYAVAVTVSATCAIFMSFHAYPGVIPFGRLIVTSGFCTLGLTWLFTLVMALRGILIRHDIAAHRFWIISNFSLTFAAVVIRGENGVILAAGVFTRVYPWLGWISWVPCIIVGMLLARHVNRTRARRNKALVNAHA
ncbi:MAG TPA: DUF2306 domain-containing protein [Humibacter sp.]|nr:DUF2306 domain-containing protein [Humibacter sp.]